MEFLLALSALLSALTGAFTGQRADVQLEQAEAQMVAVAQAVLPARIAAVRPLQALPGIASVSPLRIEALPLPLPSGPLGLVRLIE